MAQGHAVGIDYSVYPRTGSILQGFGKQREGIAKDYLATNGRNLIGIAPSGEVPPRADRMHLHN